MKMTPQQLQTYLDQLVAAEIRHSLMIWGAPGIGKSTIVAAVAARHHCRFVDLRLSQLAPTDLRGLPVAKDGRSCWYPPEFLPTEGQGILFLDEINMAPPAMQGVAQQLILDRKVGNYQVPEGWYIWAAGNRKEDKAAVFQMPGALANRFLHLEVVADLESFRLWGLRSGISDQILAFLNFRPSLLHQQHDNQPAWPSPRSWAMADRLHRAQLSVEPAIGGVADEFSAFLTIYETLPDLDKILDGRSTVAFPKEPSRRYAVTLGLIVRIQTSEQAFCSLKWVASHADAEWLQFFISNLFPLLRERNILGPLVNQISTDPDLKNITTGIRDLLLEH